MKVIRSRFVLILSSVLLSLLLAGCSFDLGFLSGSKPAPAATPPPAASSLTTYTGDGFTIGYPKDWKVDKNGTSVSFTDSTGLANFTVQQIPSPNGAIPATTAIDAALSAFKGSAKNYKEESVAPTTTVAGATWQQKSASGDVTKDGQTANARAVIMATNHPDKSPSTKLFSIVYGSPTAVYDLSNVAYFQPMLQSFKFTS